MSVIEINCKNIGPLQNVSEKINFKSAKIAIFADNGNGKSFLSSMFRLTEIDFDDLQNENIYTDKFISFGQNNASFNFKVKDEGNIIEDFGFSFIRGALPQKPILKKYIFHTFNQDYVDNNIKTLSYDKESNIEGVILGKANIDVQEDEAKLEGLENNVKEKEKLIQQKIKKELGPKLDNITDIKRLNKYKNINYESLRNFIINNEDKLKVKSYSELLSDYNKIKSIPENLNDISQIDYYFFDDYKKIIEDLIEKLKKPFKISNLSEDFKNKIKSKYEFIKQGLNLKRDSYICPFCEQELGDSALKLIDKYTQYIEDEEAKTIEYFQNQKKELNIFIKKIKNIDNENRKVTLDFNNYKQKYIPSMGTIELETLEIDVVIEKINKLNEYIDKKINNVHNRIILENNFKEEIITKINKLENRIKKNNNNIKIINKRKNESYEENKSIRENLCDAIFNELIELLRDDILKIEQLLNDKKTLKEKITKQKEKQRISKRKKVFETVKKILYYFFCDKYSLDEDTFRLIFNKNKLLDKGQAKDVLSEGEKNIISFAYYLGDIHLKISKESDYERLFLIIDDPISSMDFNHVFTLTGVIRDLKEIIPEINRERYIILTHNIEFMRILSANHIVSNKLILKEGVIKEFNNDLTVPYIGHLIDVIRVSREIVKPTHTTANSIRHIVETLAKFENISSDSQSIKNYIKENITDDPKIYTLINDFSHGNFRSEQPPILDEQYVIVCKTIIDFIENRYKGQIEYCNSLL